VNTGDRTLTRVDPTTGTAVSVSGGLAPCGITPDPSGDVWVANCYPRVPGLRDEVVRVGARTLDFKRIVSAPGGPGYYRGLVYGGGSLWVSQIAGQRPPSSLTQIDPQTKAERTIPLPRAGAPLAWSGPYGNLWIANFDYGSVTRLQPGTRKKRVVPGVAVNPASLAVDKSAIWVGDWGAPEVARINAIGSPRPRRIRLPGADGLDGVWCVAAGAGGIRATTPRATHVDAALWRIDPKTGHASRVGVPYRPACVTANASGVWVTRRP
jgi:streptogramin lyase